MNEQSSGYYGGRGRGMLRYTEQQFYQRVRHQSHFGREDFPPRDFNPSQMRQMRPGRPENQNFGQRNRFGGDNFPRPNFNLSQSQMRPMRPGGPGDQTFGQRNQNFGHQSQNFGPQNHNFGAQNQNFGQQNQNYGYQNNNVQPRGFMGNRSSLPTPPMNQIPGVQQQQQSPPRGRGILGLPAFQQRQLNNHSRHPQPQVTNRQNLLNNNYDQVGNRSQWLRGSSGRPAQFQRSGLQSGPIPVRINHPQRNMHPRFSFRPDAAKLKVKNAPILSPVKEELRKELKQPGREVGKCKNPESAVSDDPKPVGDCVVVAEKVRKNIAKTLEFGQEDSRRTPEIDEEKGSRGKIHEKFLETNNSKAKKSLNWNEEMTNDELGSDRGDLELSAEGGVEELGKAIVIQPADGGEGEPVENPKRKNEDNIPENTAEPAVESGSEVTENTQDDSRTVEIADAISEAENVPTNSDVNSSKQDIPSKTPENDKMEESQETIKELDRPTESREVSELVQSISEVRILSSDQDRQETNDDQAEVVDNSETKMNVEDSLHCPENDLTKTEEAQPEEPVHVIKVEGDSESKPSTMDSDEEKDEKTNGSVLGNIGVFESFSEDFNPIILDDDDEDEDDDLLAEPAHLRKSDTVEIIEDEKPVETQVEPTTLSAGLESVAVTDPEPATVSPSNSGYGLRERPRSSASESSRDVCSDPESQNNAATTSGDESDEVTTTASGKRKKCKTGNSKVAKTDNYSLDSLLIERKTSERINQELEELSKELQQDIQAGGIDKLNFDKFKVSVEELCPEYRQHLGTMDIQEEQIQDYHSGELVLRSGKYKCLFSYPETLSPMNCGVSGSSHVDQQLNSLPPDMLLEFISGDVLVICYKKVTKGHELLDWLFYLMSIHPKNIVGTRCFHVLSQLLFLGTGSSATWWPGPKHMATVLINYGVNLDSLPKGCIDDSLTEENLKFPDDKENSNEFDQPPVIEVEDSSYRAENLHNVLYIMTEACKKRKELFSDSDVISLIVMLMKVSLDKSLIESSLRHDLMACIAALLEAASTESWKDVVLKLCKYIPLLTSHHHNCLSLVQLLPPTGRSEHFKRHLAYAVLQKVLWGNPEGQDVTKFRVNDLQAVMAHLSSLVASKNIDFYFMSSIIRLTDLAVGNETLPSSEREDLNRMIEKMRLLFSDVKDFVNIMDRAVVKDLMLRILSKWSFMTQNMGKKQVTIFNWATQGSQSQKIVPVNCIENGENSEKEEN